MKGKPFKVFLAVFLLTVTVFQVFTGCKKDDTDDKNNTDSAVKFTNCAGYPTLVDWMDYEYSYTAGLQLKDATQTISGMLRLELLDSTGAFKEMLKEQQVTFPVNGPIAFASYGTVASVVGTYKPVKYIFRLSFKADGSSTFTAVDGTGCPDDGIFYVQDPLYGIAHGFYINALYDSVPADFVSFQIPVVMGLAGNSSTSGYVNSPSSNFYFTHNYNGTQPLSIYPNDHFTYIQSGFSASPSRTILVDNLTMPNPSKAYVRFVNLYDYSGMSLKVNGNFVSAFQSKDFREYSGFEELQPGSTNFAFHMDGLNYTIGTLNGVNLQAGKLYTVYQGGNDAPGVGNPKKLTPRIVMHN